jgi:prepilin-type N-terminal cleavage/methylation domain-containing protein
VAARIRAWLGREDGMTIIELLTTMAILGFVLSGVLVMFVGGLRAQTDLNERFQAQQDARLALTAMRKDIRGACSATVGAVTGQANGSLVTLAEPNSSSGCASGTSQSTWCADSANHAAPFALYHQAGATCAYNNGTYRAGSLTTNVVFALNPACSAGVVTRPQLGVTLPVDANLVSTKGAYTLSDTITMRNATAAVQC